MNDNNKKTIPQHRHLSQRPFHDHRHYLFAFSSSRVLSACRVHVFFFFSVIFSLSVWFYFLDRQGKGNRERGRRVKYHHEDGCSIIILDESGMGWGTSFWALLFGLHKHGGRQNRTTREKFWVGGWAGWVDKSFWMANLRFFHVFAMAFCRWVKFHN